MDLLLVVGLGWGRATQTATARGPVHGEGASISVGALAADDAATVGEAGHGGGASPPIGEENPEDTPPPRTSSTPRPSAGSS